MSAIVVLSAFLGLFFGFVSYFILVVSKTEDAALLSALAGVLFFILLFTVLLVYDRAVNKKYARIEKEINSPIFYKTPCTFNLEGGKVRSGNVYFCDKGIMCVSLEKKPYSVELILKENVEGYVFDKFHVEIISKDGRLYVVSSVDVRTITNALKSKGWID
ncbi:MAG: hypothetical protein IJC49_02190 [Clostridia bacterium]|nr:hypothetical protein [Clostridia bacterium]